LLAVLSALHLAHVPDYQINEKHFTLPRALFAALTFHLNWLEAARDAWLPAAWTVLWSLSIEEMFYLFFPLVSPLLLGRGRWGAWAWFALGITLVALGPFARVVWPHTDLQAENSYLAGMSDIAVGCMAAWLAERAVHRNHVPGPRTLLLMQATGWLPILFFATWPRWQWTRPAALFVAHSGTDDMLLALSVGLICASVAMSSSAGSRLTAPLRWMGRHSYELYLCHELIVLAGVNLFVRRHQHDASRATLAVYIVGMILTMLPLGWALAKWFSEPMNRRLRGARAAE
jgi:peptidoglycan/LPS O-acetylase OafA/YrhL